MKALLIYPEWPDTYWSFKHALSFEGKRSAFPPLGLLTVSSLLPKTWEKRLVDTNVRPLTDADLLWADVALVGAMLVQKDSMLEALARCRARGLRTVVGGPITSCMAEISMYADHVVIGEAEALMADLALDLQRGAAKPLYQAAELPSLHTTPLPDLDLINPKHYSSMAIQYSRGCPFNCEFCDIIEIYGRKPRAKAAAQVVTELEQLYRRNWRGPVFIVDDNFIGNKRKVKELLPVMADWNARRGRPFSFYTEASMNLADDTELLQMMKDTGFNRVFLGIETPAEGSLKEAQKTQNTRRSLLDSVRRIQSYGMEVMAGFIVGFDSDPVDIFEQQVKFIQESAIPLAMVGLLQAVPGTQLYRRLQREGRIVSEGHGDNLDCRLTFVPRMDPQRLVAGYRSILERIYRPDIYFQRVRLFLARYRPACHGHGRRLSISDCRALLRSIVKQGIFSRHAFSYWALFLTAATRYRRSFSAAIRLAIMGYHFQKLTQPTSSRGTEPPARSSSLLAESTQAGRSSA
ncbi:MAG TPA: B12-binding domain-containing radical SAM protein [Candidatus Acidoferrales bacterium]